MLKCIYAHTMPGIEYPSYVNFSATAEHPEQITVIVRGPAVLKSHENGSYYGCGATEDSVLSREHALDLAASIVKHYADIDEAKADSVRSTLESINPSDIRPDGRRIISEETHTIGEISSTRRMVVESMFNDEPLQAQVARLASEIMHRFPGEPSRNEGAVDVSIRLLRAYAKLVLRIGELPLPPVKVASSVDLIATGLRKGQATPPAPGEDVGHTLSSGFVSAGTRAEPRDGFDYAREQEAAHADGTNEPAELSAPLGSHGENGFDVVTEQPRPTDGQGSFSDEREAPPAPSYDNQVEPEDPEVEGVTAEQPPHLRDSEIPF